MYLFYLNDILLPITPSRLTTKIGNSNKTMELANEGEINLIKQPKLTEYSFEFDLPFSKLGYRASDNDPRKILDFLEKAKMKKEVIWFRVIRKMKNETRFPLEQQVTIESYEIVEDADENSDMTISIELKQFRIYRTKHIMTVPTPTAPSTPARSTATKQEAKKTGSIPCLKKLKILTDLNIRSGAGTHNRKLAYFRKGDTPYAYAEYNYNGTTWYRIKHSKGDNGVGWISGNPKYTKVLKDFKTGEKSNTMTVETKLHQVGSSLKDSLR